jgi:S1-C subfamily serine protease
MTSKTIEVISVSAIIILAGIVVIQSITNNRLLYVIGDAQQIPFISSIINGVSQMQNQIAATNNYSCSTTALQTAPSDTILNPYKNIALPSATNTQTTNLTSVFKRIENSVVQIISKTPNSNMQIIINGNPLQSQSARLGSGFVYDKQGCIITNNHVIDGANTADVKFVDGNTYRAKVIAKDPSSDIAVLQITDNFSPENLVPLPIVNSSSLEVGQQVIAIGNPFGLSDTMTTGIVSQVGRLIPNPDTGFSTPDAIQTDAPINPGNSGGPLLDTEGQVIGINTAINSATGEFAGIGFAVPSNVIIRELPTLVKTGTYSHPWLGISGGAMTPELTQIAGLPQNYKGVVIGSVQSGSPAEKAGLQGITRNDFSTTQQIGDIIIGIDGHPVKSIDDLISYIDLHKSVGDNVTLTINRHDQIINVNLALQVQPPSLLNNISQETILP